ncbi:DUF1232 domain-containing protein [Rhodococcus sp. YH1]|uniref:DUF1232 domain-containing protein n=1 Tax=Rhodococcus sp. YH1 TaxID=89066 RepID=UPI0013872A8F|nr:hypothetical protein [Rhodococcus sp. YH1]
MTDTWWLLPVAVLGGLMLVWLSLVMMLWVGKLDEVGIQEMARLLPDVGRLMRRLAADPGLPRGVRIRLLLALGYLLLPFDLVPDFVPILGYADDAVIVALALRSVIRRAGAGALEKHWPGTADGLAVVRRLVGIRSA